MNPSAYEHHAGDAPEEHPLVTLRDIAEIELVVLRRMREYTLGDHSSVFKRGSTVPVKFQVCDANGYSIGADGPVVTMGGDGHRAPVVLYTTGNSSPVHESVFSTTPDTDFRWAGSQWIFNLNTKNLSANVHYYYSITLISGQVILFDFSTK